MWVCASCKGQNGDNSSNCISCGNRKVTVEHEKRVKKIQEEGRVLEKLTEIEREDFKVTKEKEEREKNFITITAPILENYRIVEYKTVVTAQVVLGTGIFSELDASVSDFAGGRCTSFENKMQKAKSVAINELKNQAIDLDCNAIISADIKEVVFQNNMIAVTACGTPVVIEKKF